MSWETELYEALDSIGIETWPDVAGENADVVEGHMVWQVTDDIYTDYLDVQGFVNVIVSLDFRAAKRSRVQYIMRCGINALWHKGLLITIDRCEWYYDFEQDIRGTAVSVILRTDIDDIAGYKDKAELDDVPSHYYYGAEVVWDTELVKSFDRLKLESWPDVAPAPPDEDGQVVWRQSDELVTEYLDTPSTSQIEVELDFRAYTRSRVQHIMQQVIDRLESTGQLIRAESAQWYLDTDATANRPIRGSVITALLYPDPSIQPVGEFNSAFSSAFDVFQGESI